MLEIPSALRVYETTLSYIAAGRANNGGRVSISDNAGGSTTSEIVHFRGGP